MVKEFILQRHQKLWEEQNLFIRRLVVSILVIGFLILLKVLTPFVQDTKESITLKEDLAGISQQMAPLKQRKAGLQELDAALNDVTKAIRRAPWKKEQSALIKTLRQIKQASPDGGTGEEYQKAADSAIEDIFKQVDKKVIRPLEKALPAGQESSDLAVGIATLRTDMEQWKNKQMGKVWYRTIHEKDEKIRELDTSLREKLAKIDPLLRKAQDEIKATLEELRNNMVDLEEDIKQGEEHLKQLEKDMEQILPEWISGLIKVKQMIQLFPLLFPVAAIYVLYVAVKLSTHCMFVVRNLPLSPQDLQDLSTSSIWTLCRRGLLGTMLTTGLYFAIIGTFWVLFEQGVDLLLAWIDSEPEGAWFSGDSDISTLRWTGRSIYVALAGFFLLQLYRNRNRLVR